jgi:hypothetical protein
VKENTQSVSMKKNQKKERSPDPDRLHTKDLFKIRIIREEIEIHLDRNQDHYRKDHIMKINLKLKSRGQINPGFFMLTRPTRLKMIKEIILQNSLKPKMINLLRLRLLK